MHGCARSPEPKEHLLERLGRVASLYRLIRMQSALFHRRRQELEASPRQSSARSGELRERVVAITTLVDHVLEATNLSLDTSEALHDVVAGFRWDFHVASIPPGGIYGWCYRRCVARAHLARRGSMLERHTKGIDMGKKLSALAVVLVLVAAACGGSGGGLSSGDQELADEIAAAMLDNTDAANALSEDEAQCFGDNIVSKMGSDRLKDLGLTAAAVKDGTGPTDVDLGDEDIDAMVTVMTDCVDFSQFIVKELQEIGIPDDAVSCITDELDDGFIASMARAAFTNDDPMDNPETAQGLINAVTGCLTPEQLAELGG